MIAPYFENMMAIMDLCPLSKRPPTIFQIEKTKHHLPLLANSELIAYGVLHNRMGKVLKKKNSSVQMG